MISKDKQYRTRDGREVRIYATDHYGTLCVSGAINSKGDWFPVRWDEHGRAYNTPGMDDIVETKPRIKRTMWLNIYPEPQGATALWTRKEADHWIADDRIACVKVEIDCEEGEGL